MPAHADRRAARHADRIDRRRHRASSSWAARSTSSASAPAPSPTASTPRSTRRSGRSPPAERARIEEQMQATYELFLTRVADGRKSSKEKIDAVAQGRVWTGRQARERGLVDELGGLDRAIAVAKERAKLDVNQDVELLVYPQKPSIYEIFANPLGTTMSTRAGAVPAEARDGRHRLGRVVAPPLPARRDAHAHAERLRQIRTRQAQDQGPRVQRSRNRSERGPI